LMPFKEMITDEGGFIPSDVITRQTKISKIFVAGDITVGQKTVIDAMAHGKKAAESVQLFLQEIPVDYARDSLDYCENEFSVDLSKAEAIPRVQRKTLKGDARRSFEELEGCMSKEEALLEAKRCLSCGEPFGKFRTCWSCLPCEVECPQEALYVKIPYLMR